MNDLSVKYSAAINLIAMFFDLAQIHKRVMNLGENAGVETWKVVYQTMAEGGYTWNEGKEIWEKVKAVYPPTPTNQPSEAERLKINAAFSKVQTTPELRDIKEQMMAEAKALGLLSIKITDVMDRAGWVWQEVAKDWKNPAESAAAQDSQSSMKVQRALHAITHIEELIAIRRDRLKKDGANDSVFTDDEIFDIMAAGGWYWDTRFSNWFRNSSRAKASPDRPDAMAFKLSNALAILTNDSILTEHKNRFLKDTGKQVLADKDVFYILECHDWKWSETDWVWRQQPAPAATKPSFADENPLFNPDWSKRLLDQINKSYEDNMLRGLGFRTFPALGEWKGRRDDVYASLKKAMDEVKLKMDPLAKADDGLPGNLHNHFAAINDLLDSVRKELAWTRKQGVSNRERVEDLETRNAALDYEIHEWKKMVNERDVQLQDSAFRLKGLDEILAHIPPCPAHGPGCIPFAIEFVQKMEPDVSTDEVLTVTREDADALAEMGTTLERILQHLEGNTLEYIDEEESLPDDEG